MNFNDVEDIINRVRIYNDTLKRVKATASHFPGKFVPKKKNRYIYSVNLCLFFKYCVEMYLKKKKKEKRYSLIITDLIIDNIVQAKENKEAEIVRKRVAAEKRKSEQLLKQIQDIKN